MARSKDSTQVLKDIAQFMQWLKDAEIEDKYITEAGRGFIDGLLCGNPKYTPDFQSYKGDIEANEIIIKNQSNTIQNLYLELDKEKRYKFKFFGFKW